jgi:AraC-like DNA-binding protein
VRTNQTNKKDVAKEMKRNGIEQLQANGQEALGILARRGEWPIGIGELEIARKAKQSITYMMQRLDQPLHLANLAAAVNFSPSHFSALFKSWTGSSPIDFFIHLRMQHACWLLDNTSMKVQEVAAALGYDDPYYFSRAFKSVNRVAPSEYRLTPDKLKTRSRTQPCLKLIRTLKVIEQSKGRMTGGNRDAVNARRKIAPLAPLVLKPLE